MGLFQNEPAKTYKSPIDTLCGRLEKKMSFLPGEQDLVIMQQTFVVEWKEGTTETYTYTLDLRGEPNGYSGMSKSVGVTCGIATQLLLDGHPAFKQSGLLAPYDPQMCTPILDILVKEGIKMIGKKL